MTIFLYAMFIALCNLEIDPTIGFRYGVEASGNLYVTTVKNLLEDKDRECRPNALWQIDLDRGQVVRRTVVRTYSGPDSMALRWTIQNSIVFSLSSLKSGVSYSPPDQFRLQDVHLLAEDNPHGEDLLIKKYNLDAKHVRAHGLSSDDKGFGFVTAKNMDTNIFKFFRPGAAAIVVQPLEHAIWVSPDGLVSEFLLYKKNMYVSLAKKVSPGRGKPAEVYLSAWQKLKVDFQEPFMVFADLECHYFVTKSGKVYRVRRLDMPDQFTPKVEKYYSDSLRPVRTIVTSPDHMRTFLAGPAGNGHFYFELDYHNSDSAILKPYNPDLKAEFPKPIEDVCRFAKFLNEKMLFSMPDEKPE